MNLDKIKPVTPHPAYRRAAMVYLTYFTISFLTGWAIARYVGWEISFPWEWQPINRLAHLVMSALIAAVMTLGHFGLSEADKGA